jgi:hypothetical protein
METIPPSAHLQFAILFLAHTLGSEPRSIAEMLEPDDL